MAERGKLTGVLGLTYQGQDKEHITKVLNAILATYSAQNIERRSAESAQTLKFLDEQLPDLKNNWMMLSVNLINSVSNTIQLM